MDLPGFDVDVEPVQRSDIAEALDQTSRLDGCTVIGHTPHTNPEKAAVWREVWSRVFAQTVDEKPAFGTSGSD